MVASAKWELTFATNCNQKRIQNACSIKQELFVAIAYTKEI